MGIRRLVLDGGLEEAQKKFALLTLPKGDFWLGTSGSVRCHKPGRGGEEGVRLVVLMFFRGNQMVWNVGSVGLWESFQFNLLTDVST